METPYECYLHLPDLLTHQCPRTDDRWSAQWADEHFFIAVHQSAELLAGQALVDLEKALAPGEESRTVASVRRVTAVVELLEQHLAVLEHLSPEGFAAFRPLLDNASGAQSSQFAKLFDLITERSVMPMEPSGAGASAPSATDDPSGGEPAFVW